MIVVHKKIVTDEYHRPIAVQIDYADWLEIERLLDVRQAGSEELPLLTDLSEFRGTIAITEDPVEYQRRIRDEWP